MNQASLNRRGPSGCVRDAGGYVYAGTVLGRGRTDRFEVKEVIPAPAKFEKIVAMIEESEKLKSSVESRAEHTGRPPGSVYIG